MYGRKGSRNHPFVEEREGRTPFPCKRINTMALRASRKPCIESIEEGGMHTSEHKTNASEGVLTSHNNVSTRSDL